MSNNKYNYPSNFYTKQTIFKNFTDPKTEHSMDEGMMNALHQLSKQNPQITARCVIFKTMFEYTKTIKARFLYVSALACSFGFGILISQNNPAFVLAYLNNQDVFANYAIVLTNQNLSYLSTLSTQNIFMQILSSKDSLELLTLLSQI